MAEFFGVVKSTISERLNNIYDSKELDKEATVRKIRTVQIEGIREVNRNLEFYNLDTIISRLWGEFSTSYAIQNFQSLLNPPKSI